ncbi:hypothetical protein F5972_08725 [Microbispora cellulosiformans]|uniref:Uncharacterized protein n=1 Tax=Microbispora cellulosiformans TaxID=2614688 RepID=A0A5J5K7P9_9ACTN|nr:hypothetical protein [Microbispora cellulosiformans]KAA9379724.1 hypothetical protein F5972_08725 [Microbispora cellulosiformans]
MREQSNADRPHVVPGGDPDDTPTLVFGPAVQVGPAEPIRGVRLAPRPRHDDPTGGPADEDGDGTAELDDDPPAPSPAWPGRAARPAARTGTRPAKGTARRPGGTGRASRPGRRVRAQLGVGLLVVMAATAWGAYTLARDVAGLHRDVSLLGAGLAAGLSTHLGAWLHRARLALSGWIHPGGGRS